MRIYAASLFVDRTVSFMDNRLVHFAEPCRCAGRVSFFAAEDLELSMKPRRSFEAGHQRKFLLIIDEEPEVDSAVFFAASRVAHSGGSLVLLYVIEPQGYQHWMGVRQIHIEEETTKATALFRLHRRKLNQIGFEEVVTEDVIKEGSKVDTIMEMIDEDEDIALMVLGASTDPKGPGPLVSTLVGGKAAGAFPVPITVVPGHLSLDYIKALA